MGVLYYIYIYIVSPAANSLCVMVDNVTPSRRRRDSVYVSARGVRHQVDRARMLTFGPSKNQPYKLAYTIYIYLRVCVVWRVSRVCVARITTKMVLVPNTQDLSNHARARSVNTAMDKMCGRWSQLNVFSNDANKSEYIIYIRRSARSIWGCIGWCEQPRSQEGEVTSRLSLCVLQKQ